MMSPGFRRRPATTARPVRDLWLVLRPDRSLIRRLAGETEGDAKCRSAVERRHCELYYPRSRLVARVPGCRIQSKFRLCCLSALPCGRVLADERWFGVEDGAQPIALVLILDWRAGG